MDALMLTWIVLLTVTQMVTGAVVFGIRRRWDSLAAREVELDQAERMAQLIDLMQRHRGQLDREIHRAASLLVDQLEQDPLAREQHFTSITVLRAKLAQA